MEALVSNSKDNSGKLILLYFVLFFGIIIIVNTIFVYISLSTHTGLVEKDYYKKGIAYNEILERAKNQPNLIDKVTYNNGILRWALADNDNKALEDASVSAIIIRPVQGGYDFNVKLENKGAGVYEAKIKPPLKGAWIAKLTSKWDNKQYQTTYNFMVN